MQPKALCWVVCGGWIGWSSGEDGRVCTCGRCPSLRTSNAHYVVSQLTQYKRKRLKSNNRNQAFSFGVVWVMGDLREWSSERLRALTPLPLSRPVATAHLWHSDCSIGARPSTQLLNSCALCQLSPYSPPCSRVPSRTPYCIWSAVFLRLLFTLRSLFGSNKWNVCSWFFPSWRDKNESLKNFRLNVQPWKLLRALFPLILWGILL